MAGGDRFTGFSVPKIQDEKSASSSSPLRGGGKQLEDVRVVKMDKSMSPHVSEFAAQTLVTPGRHDYAENKAKYGSLAQTDAERASRLQRDRRFAISDLLRDPLHIGEEEQRAIDELVQARLKVVTDDARAKAAQEGYEAGLKQGHDEAFARCTQEAHERLERFEALLREAESLKQDIFKANERFFLETVFSVSKMVMLRELAADKDYLLRLTRELLERVGVRENVRIKVRPEDMANVEALRAGLEKTMGAMKNLNFEASNQVHLGGMIMETEFNAIDASLETQLRGIHAALVGSDAGAGEGDSGGV